MLGDVSPRTPPDPSDGVVYLRNVLSPEQASRMCVFLNISVLQEGVVRISPKSQAGGPPLVGFLNLQRHLFKNLKPRMYLIIRIRSYPLKSVEN